MMEPRTAIWFALWKPEPTIEPLHSRLTTGDVARPAQRGGSIVCNGRIVMWCYLATEIQPRAGAFELITGPAECAPPTPIYREPFPTAQ